MNIKGFQKSTKAQIKKYKELYNQGYSLSAIGRMFKKDHTTIWYWIKNMKKKKPQKYLSRQEGSKEIRERFKIREHKNYDELLAEKILKDPDYREFGQFKESLTNRERF